MEREMKMDKIKTFGKYLNGLDDDFNIIIFLNENLMKDLNFYLADSLTKIDKLEKNDSVERFEDVSNSLDDCLYKIKQLEKTIRKIKDLLYRDFLI